MEAATVKSATKAQELEGALSELQKAMAQLSKSTGVKAPSVRASGGGGAAPVPTGAYAPLPAMIPPFAMSAAAPPANKVGGGGPHKETFTVVSDSGPKKAAAAAGKARLDKMQAKAAPGAPAASQEGRWTLSVSEASAGKFKLNVASPGGGGGGEGRSTAKPPVGHTDFSWNTEGPRIPVGHTEFSWKAGTGGGGGGVDQMYAQLAAEKAECDKLRAAIMDKENVMVLKQTLREEQAAVEALRQRLN